MNEHVGVLWQEASFLRVGRERKVSKASVLTSWSLRVKDKGLMELASDSWVNYQRTAGMLLRHAGNAARTLLSFHYPCCSGRSPSLLP